MLSINIASPRQPEAAEGPRFGRGQPEAAGRRPKVLTLEIKHATDQYTAVHRGKLFDRSSVLSGPSCRDGNTGRFAAVIQDG